ncbi:hypothetical protein Ahy_B06g085491 [Arachis hypogaea]|uniref:Transposase MuDR plant domain-containing protein n=1 Tax=Arachis hypogaea TaxID=3818 RepID=A0A444YUS1_ARAHY|nr:hypothetical protein Ahy_B06g085491 [Arachis hypogaea]
MDDRVRLKVYYHDHILLQTSEGVKFVCDNPLDIIIPFTLSFEELKGVICERMESQISRRVSCILYRYPISVFGGFVQFQTKYVTDEASMQEMFSVYLESRSRMTFIELYIEFEQSAADRDIELEDYNSDSEEEFESNYEVVDPGVDEDQADEAMVTDVVDVANALANQQPFVEPSFMRSLDLEAIHAPEFPQYVNAELPLMPDGEFTVGMEFSSREAVIKAMKDYTIRRGVDYRVHESEPTIFYAKCTQYGAGCDWLIRVSKMSRKFCWEIRRYNGSHTCTRATISQDHSKLDSNTVAEAIKPLVEADPMRYSKCVSVRVVWSMQWTSVNNGVTVVSSKLTGFRVDMCLLVVQTNVLIGNCMYMMSTRWTRFDECTGLGLGHSGIQQHGLFTMDLDSRVSKGRPRMTRFLNEMDTRMLRGPRRCKQCGADGHSRSRCRQRGGPSNPHVSRPSISLQSTRVALHNALYRCARHVDPQLNCIIPAKLRSNGRNFQCTPTPDLSPNITVPNNNIMWHFTYL